MKKVILAAALALSALAASAADFGVTYGRGFGNVPGDTFGISVGTKVDSIGLTAAVEQNRLATTEQTRYSVTGSYDVAKVGSVTVAAKAGVGYLSNRSASDSWVGTVGVGAELPLSKTVSATVDYAYQNNLEFKSDGFNGNRVTAGLKFAF